MLIPDHMQAGLERYLFDRLEPGGFMRAVLENNFVVAVTKADVANRQLLRQWGELLAWHMPKESWGSPEKVNGWLDGGPAVG